MQPKLCLRLLLSPNITPGIPRSDSAKLCARVANSFSSSSCENSSSTNPYHDFLLVRNTSTARAILERHPKCSATCRVHPGEQRIRARCHNILDSRLQQVDPPEVLEWLASPLSRRVAALYRVILPPGLRAQTQAPNYRAGECDSGSRSGILRAGSSKVP